MQITITRPTTPANHPGHRIPRNGTAKAFEVAADLAGSIGNVTLADRMAWIAHALRAEAQS